MREMSIAASCERVPYVVHDVYVYCRRCIIYTVISEIIRDRRALETTVMMCVTESEREFSELYDLCMTGVCDGVTAGLVS